MTPDMSTLTYTQHILGLRLSSYADRVKSIRYADPLAFRARELRGIAIIKHLQRLWLEAPARQDDSPRLPPTAAPGASSSEAR